MFDLAWTEIALIAVVAVVVIGPKDLPEAIRGVAKGIQKLRRMAAEFQTHADDLVREAKLDEVRNQINEIRNFDLRGEVERAVDKDGFIRKTFEEDPFRDVQAPPASPDATRADSTPTKPAAPEEAHAGKDAEPAPAPPDPPAFIPPEVVRVSEARPAPESAPAEPAKPSNSNA